MHLADLPRFQELEEDYELAHRLASSVLPSHNMVDAALAILLAASQEAADISAGAYPYDMPARIANLKNQLTAITNAHKTNPRGDFDLR